MINYILLNIDLERVCVQDTYPHTQIHQVLSLIIILYLELWSDRGLEKKRKTHREKLYF